MKKIVAFTILAACISLTASAQQRKTKKLVFITLDGFRWQEVFRGASLLLYDTKFTKNQISQARFGGPTSVEKRAKLLPFFWEVIQRNGQLYGNRDYGNQVDCANPHWFSYPGYSEILTGFIERKVRSNRNFTNPNPTFLEFLNEQPNLNGGVACFATWETFDYILRENISNIPVNAGKDKVLHAATDNEKLLNHLQDAVQNPIGARYDAFTFQYAFEYLKTKRPDVLFIGLDETDEHGHKGHYDAYLDAAHRSDRMIARLWNWLQTQPDYKDQTTLIITTDHGRGKGKGNRWTKHGRLAFGSNQVWFAIIGPDTAPSGEMRLRGQYYLKQLAKTAASFMGYAYNNIKPVGEVIRTAFTVSNDVIVAESEP
jgi:Type I phosphodiesterase / nucleotide pyrophosphatase